MIFFKFKNKNIKEKKHKLLQKKILLPMNNLKNNLFKNKNINKKIKNIFNFKRRKTKKIIKELNQQQIKTLLFYTDINNIIRQLEFGLQPIKNIKLSKKNEYIVWTYLEKNDYLEFELDNSTRYYFWNWIMEQKVDLIKIAIIAIDIQNLFNLTKKDWKYDNINRRIKIFEDVNPKSFNWILIKNNKYLNIIKTYIKNNNLKIKIFQGEKGTITNILLENKK